MSAVWAFIGVVVGGALTVSGQLTAEWVKARFARQERAERREQLAREFQRDAVIALQRSMADYKAALSSTAAEASAGAPTDSPFARARADFQTLLHRVDDVETRDAAARWETEALAWYLDDDAGTAAREDGAWARAMEVSGRAVRLTN